MSFGGQDIYESDIDKGAALAFSLAGNHPFLDGNKRVAYVAMRLYLVSSGYRTLFTQDSIVETFLNLAAGQIGREELGEWIELNSEKLK